MSGGSCGFGATILIPNQACTIKVRSVSGVGGTHTANVKITFDDGAGGGSVNQTILQPLDATYVAVSNLIYFPTTTLDFGEVLNGSTSAPMSITLKNTGLGAASSLNFDVASLAATPFSFVSTTCGANLASSAECSVELDVSPVTTGTKFKLFRLDYVDASGAQFINLTLRARSLNAAVLELRDRDSLAITTIDFEDAPVGQDSTFDLTIRNTGGMSATGIAPSFTGTNFTVTDRGDCPSITNFSITGGNLCTLQVTFNPDAIAPFSENFKLDYNDGSTTINDSFPAVGTGALSGLLEVSGVSSRYSILNLGTSVATQTATYPLTFENVGTSDVTGFFMQPPSNSNFTWGVNGCTGTIAPSQTCEVEVIYAPSVQGTDDSTVDFLYNSSLSSKQFNFTIRAIAIRPADIFITFVGTNSPNSHDFDEVPYLVTKYLTININNVGQAVANNLSLTLNQVPFVSYTLESTNCPTNLSGGGGCQAIMSYSPEDIAIQTGALSIDYDGYGNEPLPINITFRGEGVEPLSIFTGWYEIYAATGAGSGAIRLRWEQPIPVDPSVTIDGYKVYLREGVPLPGSVSAMGPFLVKTIVGDSFPLRYYENPSANADTLYYIAVRPTYFGAVMDTTTEVSNLEIAMPPSYTALVHPYSVNREFCKNMGLIPDPDKHLGCAFTGKGSIDGYYNFNRYLYVDRYELSFNDPDYQNLPGKNPQEFSIQPFAATACGKVEVTFQSETFNKRLIRRSEFVAAAAWPEHFTIGEIEAREAGTFCTVDQEVPELTGSDILCASKYGVYDMIGNLWEWNGDQTRNGVGIVPTSDPSNDETFLVIMTGMSQNEIVDLPCFNFALGIAQKYVPAICPDGIKISTNTNLFLNDYYWPVLSSTGTRAVRSGGGVGTPVGRISGRWVGDYNRIVTSSMDLTGARCVFTREFP